MSPTETPRCDGHTQPDMEQPVGPGGSKGTPKAIMRSADVEYAELPLGAFVKSGSIPADLVGHVFIAGPRVHSGTPALSSNGIVYRLDFGGEKATITSARMRTAGWYVSRAVDDLDYLDRIFLDHALHRFRPVGLGRISLTLGAQELPNTAPVLMPQSGRLLVTTDAGRPWQIDPHTLRPISPVGYLREWRHALDFPWMLPLLQTTAHATVDPGSDDLYISNHAPSSLLTDPFTDLCRWSESDPRVRHWRLVDREEGKPVVVQTAHHLVVTRDHVVLLDSDFPVNLLVAMNGLLSPWVPIPPGFVQAVTAPETSAVATVWVVRKADLFESPETLDPKSPPVVTAQRFTVGAGGLHFAANIEEVDGRIRLIMSHTPSEDLTHILRTGEPLINGETVPAWCDGMLTPVPLIRGSIGVHDLDLATGRVDSRLHESDNYTWGIAVFSHAGALQGELGRARVRYVREFTPVDAAQDALELALAADPEVTTPGLPKPLRGLWFNAGGFTADLLPVELVRRYKNRAGPRASLPIEGGIPASIFRFDLETHAFDGWNAPPGWYAFAPTFVPSAKPGVDREDGYLVVTALSDPCANLPPGSSGDEIWIFEAQNIARGPICRLGHPDLRFGMTLHSLWIGELRAPPATGFVDLREDLDIETIRQRYLAAAGITAPQPLRAMLEPLRAMLRYVMDFEQLRRLLELQVYPYFPPPADSSSSTIRAEESTAGTPGPGWVPSPTR